ncbi:MAG: PBP1A family penicillin-binding protein [Ardenticatenaceae bacterium]|nr:PBP1A family penicillin-binding protein [Ardenticatenaceae bacterium]
MNRKAQIPIVERRQRRRAHTNQPKIVLFLQLVAALLLMIFTLVMIPASVAAVGVAYLAEMTPPWIDQVVEGTAVWAIDLYAANFYKGELPTPADLERRTEREFKTTKIYDRTGQQLLWEVYDPQGGNRQVVPLDRIPPHLRQATIALEDKTFYENPGVNLRGIARAFYTILQTGDIAQGGSSITQQLIKNVLIDPKERYQRSYERKIKEIILSVEISQRYSKDQILEWYLNTIPYGRLAYGAQAAARTYFDKNVEDLTVAEAAMLAALPNAPALYDPFTEPEAAKQRQEIVLTRMFQEGYLSFDQLVAAKAEPVLQHLAKPKRYEIQAPHFVFYVEKQLEDKYGADLLYHGGLTVYTTLDLDAYNAAVEAANTHVAELQKDPEKHVTNASVVVLNPRTGEILAMVGSLDYFNPEIDGQVNIATALRQPGSSIKPFNYVTAFAKGYTLATMVWDVRTVFDDSPNPPYVPENYDRKYHGPVLLRDAFANSYNIPAVKVLQMVGVRNMLQTAHRLGINSLNRDDYGLSLTLGGGEVSLLDLTYAYSVFANNGVMAGRPVPRERQRPGYRELDPVAILRIEDGQGKVLEAYTHPEVREVLSPQLAYLITSILSDNAARTPAMGAHSPLLLSRPAAAKTGTTNDFRDNWTMGYTPQLITGVWVGNADNSEMGHVSGLDGAAPIWHTIMEKLLADKPVEPFLVPPGLVQVQVCADSGLLPTPTCPRTRTETFIAGTQPTTPDTLHQRFRICKTTGKLATVYCPADQVEERVYTVYPPEAMDWVREDNLPVPPNEYDTSFGPVTIPGTAGIAWPMPYAYVGGVVPITGTARADNFQLYRIAIGQGLDPASWIQIGPDHPDQRENSVLEFWDTAGMEGLYTIQLTVLKNDGNAERSTVQVTVDNVAPQVKITYPFPDQVYTLGEDEWVNIQADAQDNIAMQKVEFYVDGRQFDQSTVAPFNRKWTLDHEAALSPGQTREHELYVVAVDQAGNRTQSEPIKIRVQGKKEG